ncbi:hypothetical protein PPYR_11862 [Photinus pyralis]|uniref:Uncharacterized protein n=1 Tax=Photinus pyralis TaxID=7054 RepID=A0A5N4ACG6_PHOPY|nr:hypothetical protein PPYR_11862 [Photinus pyralis]
METLQKQLKSFFLFRSSATIVYRSSNKKCKQGNAPSMNQMASNPTSPVNQPRAMNSQPYGRPINYNPSPGFNQPNNQFFTAFK